MKTKSILIALALSIGLFATSCDNEDNGGNTAAPIEGKWKLTQTGTVSGSTETLIDAPQASGCDKDYINLTVSNNISEVDYTSTLGTCVETTRNGTYTRPNDDLTTVIDGVTTVYTVVNLTATELKLREGNNITLYKR
ncbi:MAG: lipocalin family protein [Bacteroidota bacterium]